MLLDEFAKADIQRYAAENIRQQKHYKDHHSEHCAQIIRQKTKAPEKCRGRQQKREEAKGDDLCRRKTQSRDGSADSSRSDRRKPERYHEPKKH